MFLTNALRAGPGPESDFWFTQLAQPTQSGAVVTAETAMRYSTVFKCVRAYADSIGSMPRRLMRQSGARSRERVLDHPVARLLSTRPNAWQTPSQFVGMLEAHVQLRGRGYAEIFFDRRLQPESLVPLHPDRVETEVMLDGSPRWRVKPPAGHAGESRVLLPGELLHITSFTMNGVEGMSPIEVERESIGAAIAARDFGSRFWHNDARPPFWIEVPGKFKDTDDKTTFRENWQASYGGSNRHRPAVLDRGMKLHELGLNNTDSQWLDFRKYSDIDLCGIWKVPPHKVGILSDAKYANIEQQAIEWVVDSLLPRIVMWEEVVLRDLLGYDEELYLKLIPDALMRGDIKARYEAYSKGIQDGHLTRNEARELEDRDALPGLDEPLQPLNMRGANQALPAPGRNSDRAQALLQAAATRVARKEAALIQRIAGGQATLDAFAEHGRFVAEVLAVPMDVALGYVDAVRGHVQQLQADGRLANITVDDWVATQTAALLRLGA